MTKRRNYRPRPEKPPELKTIKYLLIGPDGEEHEFDNMRLYEAIEKFYPGKHNHLDIINWYCIKEDGSRQRIDGEIYNVWCEKRSRWKR